MTNFIFSSTTDVKILQKSVELKDTVKAFEDFKNKQQKRMK